MPVVEMGRINPVMLESIVDHLNTEVAPSLTPDVSTYAPGRLRVWIPYEAPLGPTRTWQPGLTDLRLESWLRRTCTGIGFDFGTALATCGGGISRHRDASYADYRALDFNLGPATFCYQKIYPGFEWSREQDKDAPVERYELLGGEVLAFNCKNPHWVENADPTRWAINVWSISKRERPAYDSFVSRFDPIRFLGGAQQDGQTAESQAE